MLNITNHQGNGNQNHKNLTLVEMAFKKNTRDSKYWWECEGKQMYISSTTMKNNMEVSQKSQIDLTHD